MQTSQGWSFDMVGHAEKCVERYCELSNKPTQQLYKVTTPCLDDHQFKAQELGSVGELPKSMLSNCPQMSVFGAIGRPDILWSVTKLARSSHSSYIGNTNSIAMWETLPNNADWDCFKTPILQEILRIQNLHLWNIVHCWRVTRLFT